MDDKYVVLFEKVITENMRLTETMEGYNNEQRKMLQELAFKRATSSIQGLKEQAEKDLGRSQSRNSVL